MITNRCLFLPLALAVLLAFPASGLAQSISWESLPNPGGQIRAIEHSGTDIHVLTSSDLFHSSDAGSLWQRAQPTPSGGYSFDILFLSPQCLFLGQYVKVYRSSDEGSNWAETLSEINYAKTRFWRGDSGQFFGYGQIYGGTGRESKKVYRFNAAGDWTATVYSSVEYINDFYVSPSGDYFIAVRGQESSIDPIFDTQPRVMHRTPDDPQWIDVPQFVDHDIYALTGVRESRSTGAPMLFAGDNGPGVWRSSDEGATWQLTQSGLTNPVIRRLAAASDGTIFAASNGGELFMTKDDGNSWANVSQGLPGEGTLLDIAFDAEGRIYVADEGGVYRSKSAVTGLLTQSTAESPAQFLLLQNYPNPFNPTTGINYHLPVTSSVRLVVYDLLGREVAVLVNERRAPGSYEVRFDAHGLPSGVYPYCLTAGGFVQTKKMVAVK